ncbi:unnamed protein product [Adineta steineri]|uniref:G-protein coupled receptors family 1 profile domain-containing protein n=1 Tax=Adineta steineri TaxID=433720 RepID=A0A819NKH4_9BILA|nr:unnamed protein product [Adineta steineri]
MLPDFYFTLHFSLGVLASVIGLTFCIMTICIVIINRQCHDVTNLLGCNTCTTAIFYYIIIIIMCIYGLREDWAFNSPQCAFRGYCYTVSIALICNSFAIQAISRLFFAVFYKYRYLHNYRTHYIMIIIHWSISFLASSIPFFIESSYGLEKESRACVLTTKVFAGSMYAGVIVCLIPLNTVTIVYAIILYRVRQSTRRITMIVPTTLNGVHRNNIATPNMKREIKIMQQMSTQSSLMSGGGLLMFFLCIWYKIQHSAPEVLYLLAITLITICVTLLTITQFIMNTKVKNIAMHYIYPRPPATTIQTTTLVRQAAQQARE